MTRPSLEALLCASQVLADAAGHAEVARLAAVQFESLEREGFYTGAPLGRETSGLMTGLAGIGYQLLRLLQPQRVPSVLLLSILLMLTEEVRMEEGRCGQGYARRSQE